MELNTTNVFLWNYKSKKKIKVNRGGTRSGKTYNLLKLFVFWLLTGNINENEKIERGILSIVRKYAATLTKTVLRDLDDIIDELGVRNLIKINKTERTYQYEGRIIELFGADDQQKLRGGKRDILYCNEANELRYKSEFFQLLMRTKKYIFLDFNPDDEDIWINRELEEKRAIEEGDVDIFVSTYRDNPFLESGQIKEIELVEKMDDMLWQVYGLGQYGKIQGAIFEQCRHWDIIDSVPDEAEYLCSGMDFGFSNDPTTLYDLFRWNQKIIADEIIYETDLVNKKIAEIATSDDIRRVIYADCAEPKSIREISEEGVEIYPSKKGKDSVNFGINLIKANPILLTARSINGIKEFKKYKWKQDRSGEYGATPIDKFNHAIDGIRYAYAEIFGSDSLNDPIFL